MLGLGSSQLPVSSQVGTIGTAVGGSFATAAGTILATSAVGGPIGIAIGGLVAAAAAIAGVLGIGDGCGNTCIQATSIVNQAEPLFQQNVAAYQAGSIDQATAIGNYNQLWGAVVTACGKISGAAGQNCVSDRQQGACKWQSNGSCWNWYIGYYMPLMVPVAAATSIGTSSSIVSSIETSIAGINPMYLIAGGIVALLMVSQ